MGNAVITGGTQGIGRAMAEVLLKNGFSIAICARNKQDLELINKEWSNAYPESTIITYQADISKKEEVLSFAQHCIDIFSTIDILVNNAGQFIPGNISDEPEGRLESLMDVNLYSAYHLTRALLPQIKKHIFNICSVASLKAYPNGGAYSITKYALLGFSENLREELKNEGIKVTSVCPGATNSRSWEGNEIDPERIMNAKDVADMMWAAYNLSAKADVELLVLRPQLGDL
ncbi:MAG: SDR family oxidoreductase [Flavipsychrobacter sp.]